MKLHRGLLLLLLLILPTLACRALNINTDTVDGSGEVVTQDFDVSGFDRVSLEGFGNVFITQGETESLSIQTDENILPYLEVSVQAGELVLGTRPNVNLLPSQGITYNITVRDLEAVSLRGSGDFLMEPINAETMDIELFGSGDIVFDGLTTGRLFIRLSGSGNIRVGDLDAQTVTTDLSGSGNITLDGTAPSQEIQVQGSGDYAAGDLESSSVEIDISGSADVTVWVTDELTVDASGSGDVRYYGNPAIDESGSGSLDVTSLGEK